MALPRRFPFSLFIEAIDDASERGEAAPGRANQEYASAFTWLVDLTD
jgi:hypothetical protein